MDDQKDVLVRRVRSIATISDEEAAAIANLPTQVVDMAADMDIVREHDRPSRSCVILEGFVYSYKITGEGKRQIVSIFVAGDQPDLQSLHLKTMDVSLGTMTPCKLGFIKHEVLEDLCDSNPRIAKALWRATLVDAAVAREWVVNTGQRSGPGRMAHLLCELFVRLKAVGLVEGMSCHVPMTQAEFGDALGFSTVHVNRTLQELRGKGLVKLAGNRLDVLDWRKLAEVADFDPTYLHLTVEIPFL
jgi:CRP-like cAMP-binding protein